MVVIGAGRVGTALQLQAKDAGAPCTLVRRDAGWEALDGPPGDPILVTVRADDLEDLLPRVPARRRDDLVFAQNGAIRGWLASHGLAGCTRGLLFFAVAAKGSRLEPGKDSPFCGPYAHETVRWLVSIGVGACVVDWARFSAAELEKLIWNAAFGLLCEAHGTDVGGVVRDHRAELHALAGELSRVGRASMGVDPDLDRLVDRLCAYSLTIPTYRGAVKEWRWRNGWFVEEAARFRVDTPVHHALLRRVGRR